MKTIKDKWVPTFFLILVAIVLSASAVFLPWWSINTSPNVSVILNSQIKTDYYLLQTVSATKTISNVTEAVNVAFNNLTEKQEDAIALALWFNVVCGITISGLGLSCLTIVMVVLARSKESFRRYSIFVGYIAAILLSAAPIILMANFSPLISNFSKLTPLDIPSAWPPITPKNINNFWGSIKAPKVSNLPEWAAGVDFWVWGGDSGLYLTFTAGLLMFFASTMIRTVIKKETTEVHEIVKHRPAPASSLTAIGGVLTLINVLLINISKGPLILSTSSSSPQEIIDKAAPLWARVSFGIPGWIEGPWTIVWLIFAIIIIYCSMKLYMEPIRRKVLCPLIIILSIVSILCGGGFLIGSALAVIGGAVGFEWPSPLRETFFGKLIRTAKLDTTFYKSFNENPHSLRYATYTLIFVSILSGLGCGLYALTTETIVNAKSLDIPYRILMLGEVVSDISILSTAIINIILATLKWITLSVILYLVTTLSLGSKTNIERIGTAVAFAYVPVSLQFFMPFLLFSEPYLTFTWPLVVFAFTNLWMILILIVATREILETSLSKALGIVSLSGALYLWINQTFFMKANVPYSVKFFIQPEPVFLTILACLVVLAIFFGVFRRR